MSALELAEWLAYFDLERGNNPRAAADQRATEAANAARMKATFRAMAKSKARKRDR